jgi:rhamnogalacturonan endolyase
VSFPQNSAVWWDGDLLRELLDRTAVLKWNWTTHQVETLKNFRVEGCAFNNGSKQNPCLSADILGDWREEVVVRNQESTELRIYSTTIPTTHRFPCLMLDVPYRLSVATENVGYNQPPEPGIYLGSDLYKRR